jgi:DNA-binding transcriptional regulator YhcF (GntR family)
MAKLSYKVKPDSKESMRKQLFDQILNSIKSGKLKPGDLLPPRRVLSQQLNVGPTLVFDVYTKLKQLGLVETSGTSGTVVKAKPKRNTTSYTSATKSTQRQIAQKRTGKKASKTSSQKGHTRKKASKRSSKSARKR